MPEEIDQAQEAEVGLAADAAAEQGESRPAGGSRVWTQAEVDAYVKRRIDKQRAKHDEETEALSASLAEATAAREAAEQETERLRHERELAEWAQQAAAESGVPASVIRGATLDEMREHAALIRANVPAYPVLPHDGGEADAPALTKEAIYAIRNREERVLAMGQHPELFE